MSIPLSTTYLVASEKVLRSQEKSQMEAIISLVLQERIEKAFVI